MTERENGWVEWKGGENPVPGQRVRFRMRGFAKPSESEDLSDRLAWNHPRSCPAAHIIAYRLVTPASDGGALPAQEPVVGWQPIETAPRDQVIIAMARYQTATAGFPAFVHFVDGDWRLMGRTRLEPMVCWAWISRDILPAWPNEPAPPEAKS